MEIGAMLDELREMALKDEKIRQELMDTRKDTHPLAAFCRMQPCAEVLMAAEKIRLSWREKMIFMNYFLQVWSKKTESIL